MAKLISVQQIPPTPPPLLQIKDIRNSKDARRLLSKIISGFIRKEIEGTDAKTLGYLLSVYCQIESQSDLLNRIERLEKGEQ